MSGEYGRYTIWASESVRPVGTVADAVIRDNFFGAGEEPPAPAADHYPVSDAGMMMVMRMGMQ